MQEYESIDVDQAGEIVTVALNRPKLNLFNERMMRELIQAFSSQRENTTARFIILTARGDHFSGGIDLKEINDRGFTAEDARKNQLLGHACLRARTHARASSYRRNANRDFSFHGKEAA